MAILRKDLAPGTLFRYLNPTPGFESHPLDVRVVDEQRLGAWDEVQTQGTFDAPRPSPGCQLVLDERAAEQEVVVFTQGECANDAIPLDEMLLAQMVAEAKAHGLQHITGMARTATGCCAIGAIGLLYGDNTTPFDNGYSRVGSMGLSAMEMWDGNDYAYTSWGGGPDRGGSIGLAFRHAMTAQPG